MQVIRAKRKTFCHPYRPSELAPVYRTLFQIAAVRMKRTNLAMIFPLEVPDDGKRILYTAEGTVYVHARKVSAILQRLRFLFSSILQHLV